MQRPVILGLVSYRVFPAEMGGQKYIVQFYRELSRQAKVLMAAARQNTDTGEASFPVFPFLFDHWKGILNIFYLYRLVKLVKKQQVDILLIEHSYFGFLGILLRRLTRKPFVIRSQNIEAHRFRDMGRPWWWLYERYERFVHREADHNFFITAEDRQWAIDHWELDAGRCSVSTYGSGLNTPVTPAQRQAARTALLEKYGLPATTRLFLFNGSLDYLPNTDALRIIVTEILPVLRQTTLPFRIIVCGKGLNDAWQKELNTEPAILYEGFVTDIDRYFMGADCLINPITLGGGIRTKMIEALAHDQTVISTASSARGVSADATGGKLVVVPDYDWAGFAEKMASPDLLAETPLPASFHHDFQWRTIVQRALLSLQAL